MSAKKVKYVDKGWEKLKNVLARMKAKGAYVKVGVLGNSGTHHSGFSMVELATVHEYGSTDGRIPARSFIFSTLKDKQPEMAERLKEIGKLIVEGKLDPIKGLNQLGLWGANTIKRRIAETDIPPPLAVATIKRKGSSKPLVDTGQLINSISWEVVE